MAAHLCDLQVGDLYPWVDHAEAVEQRGSQQQRQRHGQRDDDPQQQAVLPLPYHKNKQHIHRLHKLQPEELETDGCGGEHTMTTANLM